MKISRVVAMSVAGAMLCAGSASMGALRAKAPNREKGQSMMLKAAGQRLHPLRMAKFVKVDGRIVLTTPWYAVAPAGSGADTTLEPAFDCYEGDPNSVPDPNQPTGFLTCGNNSAFVGATPDSRWYSGPTAPAVARVFNDMTVASGFAGLDAEQVSFAWNPPVGSNQTTIAVSTFEDFGSTCVFPAAPGPIDGVIFDFGIITQPPPPNGYAWADININSGPTPLTIGLPVDGSGAYEIEFFSDIAGTTLQTLAGTQPMFWGTGEDEWVADGRAGTQDINEFDDDTAPYGGAYGATECYDLTAGPTQCPRVLGPMMLFWAKGGACYADCNGDGNLTVQDFGCFQTKFVAGDPYADCNGDGNLTVQDFGCFQTKFVAGCP